MPVIVGQIEAIFRYPIKSMRGEPLEQAVLGWHGLEGDRRLAFRRLDERGGFPWLTASKLPDLLLFTPQRQANGNGGLLPTHVLTPDGQQLPVFSEALAAHIKHLYGSPVEMMQMRNGIFDDATVSVITSGTIREVCRLGGLPSDIRRFRPNIVVRSTRAMPFEEDAWVGSVLTFGGDADAPAVTVTIPDLRCAMVNFDPDTAASVPQVLKGVVRANGGNAGIYGAVTRAGQVSVGQNVILHQLHEARVPI